MFLRYRILATVVCFGIAAGVAACVGSSAATAAGRTFYVSASGSDRHSGTDPASAWRTISRVDEARLQPGDRVLFHGGDRFGGATLIPRQSGTAGAPITFGSYGGGHAHLTNGGDVWIAPGGHDMVFVGLDFSGPDTLFASAATGPGTYNITIKRCSFHDTPNIGLSIATHADHDWTITHSSFRHIGDSGLIIWGANVSVTRSSIIDTGWNSAVTYGKHGIYLKGRHALIAHNYIAGFQADGVSLRSDNALVTNNTIRGGSIGIAYYDDDDRSGTTQVQNNAISRVQTGFYFSDESDTATGGPPIENFLIRHNVFQSSGRTAIDITGARYSRLELAQNILRGPFLVAVAANTPTNNGRYLEAKNFIYGSGIFMWNSTTMPYRDYRASTGLGIGDHIRPLSSS